jgi:hypothetical protein
MKKEKNKSLSLQAKKAAVIRVNKKLNGEAISAAFQKASFFKKKMERGAKMISIAGLPK